MSNVGRGVAGQVYTGKGSLLPPSFQAIGTNSGLTSHGVVLSQGNSAFVSTAVGTTGQVLTGVTGSDPVWASFNQFAIMSPVINFKSVGTTVIFTTPASLRFCPTLYQFICDTATAATGGSQLNIGWTAANYSDYVLDVSFTPTVAGNVAVGGVNLSQIPAFPSSTNIIVNVTIGDPGTAITGRVAIYGIYI